VLFPIKEYIDEDIANVPRRLQRASMVAVREDAAARPEQAIDATGDPDGKPLHTLTEAPSVVGFDDQMDVVRLHAEVHDTKKTPLRLLKLGNNTAKERLAAQTRQPGADPNGDMQRLVSAVGRSAQVRNSGAFVPRLSPCTPPPTAPGIAQRKIDLGWHLN
jgi:hypothetical protein